MVLQVNTPHTTRGRTGGPRVVVLGWPTTTINMGDLPQRLSWVTYHNNYLGWPTTTIILGDLQQQFFWETYHNNYLGWPTTTIIMGDLPHQLSWVTYTTAIYLGWPTTSIILGALPQQLSWVTYHNNWHTELSNTCWWWRSYRQKAKANKGYFKHWSSNFLNVFLTSVFSRSLPRTLQSELKHNCGEILALAHLYRVEEEVTTAAELHSAFYEPSGDVSYKVLNC